MSEDIRTQIGTKIRETRKKTGLSREDLANRVGVSFHTLCDWETGKSTPGADMLVKICRVFNMDIFSFIGATGDKEEKILISYKNSLAAMQELDKDSKEYQFEFGRAFAYEQMLRSIGMEVYTVARLYWGGEKEENHENGSCKL